MNMASFGEWMHQSFSHLIYCFLLTKCRTFCNFIEKTSNALFLLWKSQKILGKPSQTDCLESELENRLFHVCSRNSKCQSSLVPWNIRQFIEFWLEILCGWLENWQLELWFHKRKKGWTPHDMFFLRLFKYESTPTFQTNISFVYRGWSVDNRTSRAYNSVCIIIPKTICEASFVHRPRPPFHWHS